MKDNARIMVRMRPLLKFQDEPAWITSNTSIKCMHSKSVRNKIIKTMHSGNGQANDAQFQNYQFKFDKVIDNISSQKIYKSQIKKIIQKSMNQQRNCTIVAYGQTCSGKTYTLLGIKQAPGFIPCIFRDIFNQKNHTNDRFVFQISYLEIYNEKLIDLLNTDTKDLKITKDNQWGNEVLGSTKVEVSNFEDCLDVLDKGENNRKYGEKLNHQRSSRSHTLLKIYIQRWNDQLKCYRSTINVVDLAGSQRLTSNEQNNQQTGHINKSLFQFSNVISKLSQGRDQHIPYRDSKLTRLLQNSLSKNSNLAIVFCISPAVVNFGQSVSTLRLATKAKKVQIQNPMHLNPQNADIKKLHEIIKNQQQEIKKLKQKIQKLTKQIQKVSDQQTLRKKYQQIEKKSHSNTTNIQIKALVLLDHQNFMLSMNNSVFDMENQKFDQIKDEFLDEIGLVYERYIGKIIDLAANLGYDEAWLKIQDICFSNIIYDKTEILQYKIPILKQLCQKIEPEHQTQFSSLLQNYINKIQQSLTTVNENFCKKKKHLNKSSKYLCQSPIFEQSTIQAMQNQKSVGTKLLSWGCKKDSRVFKNQNPSNDAISSLSNLGQLTLVACGAHHTLVLTVEGEVYGWGKNQHKQICNSKSLTISIPKSIQLKGRKIKSIAAGWAHSLLLSTQGEVYSFGFGEDGQLGHGNVKNISQPMKIQTQSPVSSIYAGHSHSGFIDRELNYYAFGFNKDYRLMIGESKQSTIPHRVNLKGIVKAALGVTHSCLLSKQGKVYCGGVGTNWQLGVDLNPTITGYQVMVVPQKNCEQNAIQKICPMVQLQFFSNQTAIDISCGQCSTAVITENHQLYTFGKASFDRLGHPQSKIVKILQNVNKVQMGYRHGFAWNSQTKQVYGWGFNMYNQLGSLQAKDLKSPEIIQFLSAKQISHISTGFFHSSAIAK